MIVKHVLAIWKEENTEKPKDIPDRIMNVVFRTGRVSVWNGATLWLKHFIRSVKGGDYPGLKISSQMFTSEQMMAVTEGECSEEVLSKFRKEMCVAWDVLWQQTPFNADVRAVNLLRRMNPQVLLGYKQLNMVPEGQRSKICVEQVGFLVGVKYSYSLIVDGEELMFPTWEEDFRKRIT